MELLTAAIGGMLIGCAAAWLFVSTGRIAGISGITAQALNGLGWPLLFLLGLGIGGWLASWLIAESSPEVPSFVSDLGNRWIWLVSGGLFVGFGTRMGSGCTSGHGVCGIARLSGRSLTATCVFLGVGMLTATLLWGWLGSVGGAAQ